jgi:hypothetical protein
MMLIETLHLGVYALGFFYIVLASGHTPPLD